MTVQKRRWRVRVLLQHEFEVDAVDWIEAHDLAKTQSLPEGSFITRSSCEVLSQEGEPWASGGWYDLHGPGDVIVIERAHGHCFTARDIELLTRRLTALGLRVLEHWNGEGTRTVTFRCSGRQDNGPMSAPHAAALLAPRPDEQHE